MAYIEKLLSEGEKVLFNTKRHAFVLLGHVLKELLVLGVLIVGLLAVAAWNPPQLFIFQIAFALVALIVIASLIVDVVRWRTEEFFVTNRRVIKTSGIFNKHILDSSLGKINDVEMVQSWAGRMFNYGSLKILTATEEIVNVLDRISNPMGFKHAMLNAKNSLEIPASGPRPVMQGGTVTQKLEELLQLKNRNIISEQEYEEKRKEILKQF